MKLGSKLERVIQVDRERFRATLEWADGRTATVDLAFLFGSSGRRPLVREILRGTCSASALSSRARSRGPTASSSVRTRCASGLCGGRAPRRDAHGRARHFPTTPSSQLRFAAIVVTRARYVQPHSPPPERLTRPTALPARRGSAGPNRRSTGVVGRDPRAASSRRSLPPGRARRARLSRRFARRSRRPPPAAAIRRAARCRCSA